MSLLVHIAPLAPIDSLLTYKVPNTIGKELIIGQRVLIPLGRRKVVGIYLGPDPSNNAQNFELKDIDTILDDSPCFNPTQMNFLKWAAQYYLCPLGEMFKTALPAELTKIPKEKKRKTKTSVLTAQNLQPVETDFKQALSLSTAQQQIVDTIAHKTGFQTHLIHGVTGSGKTEIYLELIRQCLQNKKQALCLVPEIGLTPQLLSRFQKIFASQVQTYHSNLTDKQRLQIWQQAQSGQFSVLLGTRSSLFIPFKELGLIIVDEEHDSSYKQEERLRYHARDLAIVKAKFENIPVILGSATPSIETYYKATTHKYLYHPLNQRFGSATLPEISFVDLKQSQSAENLQKFYSPQLNKKNPFSKNKLLSPELLQEIAKRLELKEQVLVFLNRRGFSHYLLCEDCAYSPRCLNCDITLTYHQKKRKLICHYCDFSLPAPEICPQCHSLNWLPMGSGTEKIEQELEKIFPQAKIARMDRDSTSKKGSLEHILKSLAEQKIDLLVGTQMIAKGHDYPNVTLVGILLADAGLHHPDFRAAEVCFQTLSQVSGRAGRAQKSGQVLLQCFESEHYALQYAALHQQEKFYQQELQNRKELNYPPFSRLLILRFQGSRLDEVKQDATQVTQLLQQQSHENKWQWQILGPAPCLMERLNNQYRWQILIKNLGQPSFQQVFLTFIPHLKQHILHSGTRLIVDVDPLSV